MCDRSGAGHTGSLRSVRIQFARANDLHSVVLPVPGFRMHHIIIAHRASGPATTFGAFAPKRFSASFRDSSMAVGMRLKTLVLTLMAAGVSSAAPDFSQIVRQGREALAKSDIAAAAQLFGQVCGEQSGFLRPYERA